MAKLYDLLAQAGFSGDSRNIMYGIVMAESGGNAWAFNPNADTGDLSYGLAQINMLGTMGPDRRRAYGLSNNNDLFDPLTNLRAAWKMSEHGSKWSDWSTWNRGEVSTSGPYDAEIVQRSEYGSPTPPVVESANGDSYNPGGKPSKPGSGTYVPTLHPMPAILQDLPQHGGLGPGQRAAALAYIEGYASPGDKDPLAFALALLQNTDWTDYQGKVGKAAEQGALLSLNKGHYDSQLVAIINEYKRHVLPVPAGYQYDTHSVINNPLAGVLKWTEELGKLLGWLIDPANWKRIGLFVLGAVILAFAAFKMFGGDIPKVVPV